MTNDIHKTLQALYHSICSIEVDFDRQSIIGDELIKALSSYDAERRQHFDITNLDQLNTPLSYQEILLKHAERKNELVEEVENFPRYILPLLTTDRFYRLLDEKIELPTLLKFLLVQFRMPLLRLCFDKPEFASSIQNSFVQLSNMLISYRVMWKDEQNVGFPTFNKLFQLSDFNNKLGGDLESYFRETKSATEQTLNAQQKRGLIFEKRLRETELTSSTNQRTEKVIEKLLAELTIGKELPDWLSDFLNNRWKNLLRLEMVRQEDEELLSSIKVAILLIDSIYVPQSKSQFDNFMDHLPYLNEHLVAGFRKLAVDANEVEEFISQIESIHIQIIAECNQKFQQQGGDKEESQKNNQPIDEDDIIRLKPTPMFEEGTDTSPFENSSAEPTVQTLDDSINDDEFCIEELDNENSLNISSFNHLTPLQRVREILAPSQDEVKSLDLTVEKIVEYYDDIEHIEIDDLCEQLNREFGVREDQWFEAADKTYHKLLLENIKDGQYIFVNQDAVKSLALPAKELKQKLTSEELKVLSQTSYYQQALTFSLKKMKPFVQRIKVQNEKINTVDSEPSATTITEVDVNIELATDTTPPKVALDSTQTDSIQTDLNIEHKDNLEERSTIESETPPTTKTNEPSDVIAFDIARLTVGSWVTSNHEGAKVKCKLAAKIASKNLYIFVDRQGKKIMQLSEQEILKRVARAELTMVTMEVQNEQLLASVISKNRTLKSDH